MRAPLAVLALALSLGVAHAEEDCFKCKLHAACPLPDFLALSRCLVAKGRPPEEPQKPAAAAGWVDTPCGRIRASVAQAADRP